MKCPHCGFSMDNNSSACPVCGKLLYAQPVNQPQQPTQQIPQQPMQQMPQQPMQQMPQQPMQQMPQQPRYPSQPLVDHNTPHMPPDPVKPRNKGVVIAIAIIVAAVIAAGAVISILSALFYRQSINTAFGKSINSVSEASEFSDDYGYDTFIDTITHENGDTVNTDWADITLTAVPEETSKDGYTSWNITVKVNNTSDDEYSLYEDPEIDFMTEKSGESVQADLKTDTGGNIIEAKTTETYERNYLISSKQASLYVNFMITLKKAANTESGTVMYHIDTAFNVTNYNTTTEPATTQPATNITLKTAHPRHRE